MSARLETSLNRYFDANAGAPLGSQAREALFALLEQEILANPSSAHALGRAARKYLNQARAQVLQSFGCATDSNNLVFTASGSEASQMAIRAALEPELLQGKKPHLISSPVEHAATLQMHDWLRDRGGSVSMLPVDSQGSPRVEALLDLITPLTRLVSVIWVNNETGVVSDVEKMARLTQKAGVPLHLDGAQAWGKLALDLPKSGATWVSFSGHKIGALSGTGVLWCAPLAPRGQRAGTENLAGIVTLGAAAQALEVDLFQTKLAPVREALEQQIVQAIAGVVINGRGASRVANTLNLSFKGIPQAGLVAALDLQGYAVSAGSACQNGVLEPSHVLLALGHTRELASSSIRISLSHELTQSQMSHFVKALAECVERMRKTQL